jgi:hypothetical protein
VAGACCRMMVDGVLMMRQLSSLRVWEGCDLRTGSIDDMKAEAGLARLPAEEAPAAACFA